MKKIAIIGAGGFGREIKTIIDSINKVEATYEFIGFYDDAIHKEKLVNGFPLLGAIKDLNSITEELCVLIAVGNPAIKKRIYSEIDNDKIIFPNLISPHASISDDFVNLGKGNIICAGTIITCNIEIKDFVILNLMCSVGHDTIINSYCSFMPAVNISGEVTIEKGVYIGTGAKIINQLEIGENTIIGAGAVVTKSIPGNCTAVGTPAKVIKQH